MHCCDKSEASFSRLGLCGVCDAAKGVVPPLCFFSKMEFCPVVAFEPEVHIKQLLDDVVCLKIGANVGMAHHQST